MSRAKAATKAWSWQINLLAFALVTLVVLLYSLGQVYYLRQALKTHLRDNRQMVLRAVNRQTELGFLAEEALNDTIRLFLSNTARFLNFLHTVEPFQARELASFADENSLAGVAIRDSRGTMVGGPEGWLPVNPSCSAKNDLLRKVPGLYLLTWPRPQGGCVLVGYPDRPLQQLQEQFSLASILAFLSSSPEITFVEVADPDRDYQSLGPEVALELIRVDGRQVVVGFDTRPYQRRLRQIWQNFLLYASFFVGFGLLLTFVLYRLQQQHIAEITRYERQLAREQEDAVLGRAAATIAHEVRNPLNAIGMGLQRIDLEAELAGEHRELVAAMETAMRRTNTIVEGLLSYARPLAPRLQPVEVDQLLRQQILLRREQCRQAQIEVELNLHFDQEIQADGDLLAQLFDNILKNGIEAQPDGGWLRIDSAAEEGGVRITVANAGFGQAEDIHRLAEPYFTGKIRGSGLGLAISTKIVEAHQGTLTFDKEGPGVLQVRVWLPMAAGSA